MKLGLIFPQTQIGSDPGAIREYAQTAEGLGFDHLAVYEHVLGAGLATRPDWWGVYSYRDMFHEPFVLLGYLAAITERIGFCTDVLVLPQRQTVIVAKQVAEVDLLSGGRLRLGVGVGWNELEYTGLGEDFHNRGKRLEEQVALLRALWTNEVVTFAGNWHTIPDAGISPLPVQRPIPIWMGGSAENTIKRVAALADGWFPLLRPDERAEKLMLRLRELVAANGRRWEELGIEPEVNYRPGKEERMVENARAWREMGATHIAVNTMQAEFKSPGQHVAALEHVRELMRRELGL